MNILVTVGCSNYKFDRLFKILDILCEENVIDASSLIAQTGNINYNIKNYKNFDFESNEKLSNYRKDADIIICHAGTGSVVGALKDNKKVIVFPRLFKYNEHESDHQLDLARTFKDEKYVLCAMDYEELKQCIKEIDKFVPKKFISNTKKFCELIEGLL